MKSAMLGLDSKIWEELYDKILETQNLPEPIRERLELNKKKIQAIYKWIEGEWWKIEKKIKHHLRRVHGYHWKILRTLGENIYSFMEKDGLIEK